MNDLVVVVLLKHLVMGFELWIMLRLVVLRNKDSVGKKREITIFSILLHLITIS